MDLRAIDWSHIGTISGRPSFSMVVVAHDESMSEACEMTRADAMHEADDWIALVEHPLQLDVASTWVVRPDCGAVVVFAGTVRDHADGRAGVSELVYEAYVSGAMDRMGAIVAEARRRAGSLGRVALWHRTGRLAVTDVAVVVAVSSPHRAEAFEAARWIIDTVKSSVPIWKQETWDEGRDWGVGAQAIADVDRSADVDRRTDIDMSVPS